MNPLSNEQIRFWEIAWHVPKCDGGFSRSLFFSWDEMLAKFTDLYFDEDYDYSVSVYVHFAPSEPEALVKFLDDFVHNLMPVTEVTSAVEYLARVVTPMRKLIGTYNVQVAWEKDWIALREKSECTEIEALRALLIVDRPILLLGTIIEITQREDAGYDVIFRIHTVYSENYDLESDCLVSLRADDSLAESLFEYPPTHTRPEHEIPTIALFANIKNVDICDADDQHLQGCSTILFGDLVEFYYSDLIFERSYVANQLVSLLSDQLDPRDFCTPL